MSTMPVAVSSAMIVRQEGDTHYEVRLETTHDREEGVTYHEIITTFDGVSHGKIFVERPQDLETLREALELFCEKVTGGADDDDDLEAGNDDDHDDEQ